jgi:hypothetical protein
LDATCADEKDQERDPYLPPKPALLTDITAKVRVCPKEFFGQKELHSRITIVASKRQRYSAIIKGKTEHHSILFNPPFRYKPDSIAS